MGDTCDENWEELAWSTAGGTATPFRYLVQFVADPGAKGNCVGAAYVTVPGLVSNEKVVVVKASGGRV